MDPVAICNMALGWLGVKPIHSFEDDSTAAELCSAFYEPAVRAVLEARPWMFATGYRTVEAPQESGVAELPELYALPADVVTVQGCDDGSGSYTIQWRRAQGGVLTEAIGKLHYRATVVVEADRFSAAFARCVAFRLAADLAGPLTDSARRANDYEQLYSMELQKAGSIDGMQGKSEPFRRHTLKSRRY